MIVLGKKKEKKARMQRTTEQKIKKKKRKVRKSRMRPISQSQKTKKFTILNVFVFRRKRGIKKILFDFGIAVIITLLLLIIVASYFFSIEDVNGFSMMPYLRDGDLIIASKRSKLKRFDLVLYRHGKDIQIRRLIGLPKEKIHYENDTLLVNDKPIDEKFIVEEINESQRSGRNFTEDFSISDIIGEPIIPDNFYLLLSDDRQYAADSRDFGLVPAERIVGRVFFVFYPVEHIKVF